MMKNKVLKKALAPALALTLVSAVIPTPLAANALSKSDFYRYNGYYVLEVGDIVSFNDENKVNQIVGMNGSQILTGDELDLVALNAIYPYVYSEISDRVINYTDKNGVQGSVDDYYCALSLNSLSDYEWVIEDEDGVVYETWGPEIDEVYGPYLANAASENYWLFRQLDMHGNHLRGSTLYFKLNENDNADVFPNGLFVVEKKLDFWGDILYVAPYFGGKVILFTSEDSGSYFTNDYTEINSSQTSFTLPECTLTPPSGKTFSNWKVGNNVYAPGDTITLTDNVTSVEAVWKEKETTSVKFTTNSMTLGGAISLNFYIDLSGVPEDYLQYSYVEFEVNGKKQKANFNPNKTNKAGNYGFNCALNSISMADDVKATLHYYDVNGDEKSLTHTASCETYLKKFNENDAETTWNIIKAINDYGYYMQQHLKDHSAGSWTLGVDHKAMEKYFNNAVYYRQNQDKYRSELKKMKVQKVWGTNSDIDKVNYSLVLDSNTAINFKITKKEGYTGKFEVKLDDKKVTPKDIGDNRYQVTASGISAHLLAEPHTVTVTTDHGTSTYTASALSYAYECIDDPHYNSEISAFGALYEYYKATIAYKAAH